MNSIWIPEHEVREKFDKISTVRFDETYLIPSSYIYDNQELFTDFSMAYADFPLRALYSVFFAISGETDLEPHELEKKIVNLYRASFGDFDDCALRLCKAVGDERLNTKFEDGRMINLDYVIGFYRTPENFCPPCHDAGRLNELAQFLSNEFSVMGSLKMIDTSNLGVGDALDIFKYDCTIVGNLPSQAKLKLINGGPG